MLTERQPMAIADAEFWVRCWPWLLAIVAGVVVLRGLLVISGARLQLGELKRLHQDQVGGVQTLSFVLTVPAFLMVMMFIVQLSQITIAQVVVEYAAFAAARSAVVWIPAATNEPTEGPNRISERVYVGSEASQVVDPALLADTQRAADRPLDYVPAGVWAEPEMDVYWIVPEGPKYRRIHQAAAMACLPICPSRDLPPDTSSGESNGFRVQRSADAVWAAYQALRPATRRNTRMPRRIRNKVAYALGNTNVWIEVRHRRSEPPLEYLRTPTRDGWAFNEIGWQDQVTVHVTHHYALLPGPGRLLARPAVLPALPANAPPAAEALRDEVAQQVTPRGSTYTYALTASARLTNQGHIPSRPFVQESSVRGE